MSRNAQRVSAHHVVNRHACTSVTRFPVRCLGVLLALCTLPSAASHAQPVEPQPLSSTSDRARGTGAETMAFTPVALLDHSDGSPHYGKRGMGVGLLVGAASGFAIIMAEPFFSPKFPVALYGAAIGGGAGAIVGGLIGRAIRRETRQPVELSPGEMGLSVRPLLGAGQRGVAVQMRW